LKIEFLLRRQTLAASLVVTFAVSLCGCSGNEGSTHRALSLPTSPSSLAEAESGEVGVAGTADAPFRLVGDSELTADTLAVFPPRNEPFQFRQTLEGYYRDTLRRGPVQTAVDLEGGIVWTQEYLRYRLSGCQHSIAVMRVLSQIDGSSPPECGGIASFPPRNEALDFRSNHLESKYRDGLRRSLTTSFVDVEGDVVWTTEYFRYRLSGCDHENASSKTLQQVGGAPAPATCQTMLAIWTSANAGWSSIAVTINGRPVGTLARFYDLGISTSCTAVDGARVVAVVAPGTVTFSARSDRATSWSGSRALVPGECRGVELTCTNRNCAPISSAPPPPRPPATPPPTGSGLGTTYHVRGGRNDSQYLGYFSCVFCQEYGSDSINNEYGRYGSPYSSTSIRNTYGDYGSPYSNDSACNEYASNPPRVFDASGNYYGELTLNQYRSNAITNRLIVSWLSGEVCR
jgi:hypothetical protein